MKVIILHCYSRNALAVINSLGPDCVLIGGEARRDSFPLGNPDRFFHSPRLETIFRYTTPRADPEAFARDVIEACNRYEADVVVPCGTTITNWLSKHKARVEGATRARLAVEDFDVLGRMTDKWGAYQAALEANVPVPRTLLVHPDERFLAQAKGLRYPIVIKPRMAFAAQGVEFFRSFDEFAADIRKRPGHYAPPAGGEPPIVVQEAIDGTLHDVALCARDGEIISVMTQQRMVTLYEFGGGGIINRTTDEPKAIEPIRRLVKHVRWNGLVIFDLIKERATGDYYMLECNPKVWGTTQLTTEAGLNMCRQHVDVFAGRNVAPATGGYQRDLLYRFWFPECWWHWIQAPLTPGRFLRRVANTFRRFGAREVRSNLARGNRRHIIGIYMNYPAGPPRRTDWIAQRGGLAAPERRRAA